MKKKTVLIFGLALVGLFSLGTSIAWGEVSSLPRVTIACESKAGLLMTVDDDFSILKKCPKNFRKVILGEDQKNNGNGNTVVPESGEIAFANGPIVLMKDGTVWIYNTNTLSWEKSDFNGDGVGEYDITSTGKSYKDIIQWYSGGNLSFITKNGEYWLYNDADSKWIKATDFN